MTDRPRPSEIPGAAGPVVPLEPPTRLPGRSAAELGRLSLLVFALLVVAWVAVLVWVDPVLVVLGSGLALFAAGWILSGRVGDRLVEELGRGYTTLVLDTGMFWFRPAGWTPWDFDGVWRFTRDGVQPPRPGATDPPGLYPSPHRPGRREVWTGRVWTKVYR